MKSKRFKFIIIVISFLCSYFLTFQRIQAGNLNEQYITKFDVEMLAEQKLQDFKLIKKRVFWNRGRRYLFKNEVDNINLSIQVGLYASAKQAGEVALDYLNSISTVLVENPSPDLSIGDKFWGGNSDIIFIRNNALVMITSYKYKNIKELAKSIDNDITNEAAYVSIESEIQIPKINSVSIDKSILHEGESSKITINATDRNLESLVYEFLPGLIKESDGPKNVFTFLASKYNLPDKFLGSHTIKLVLINENNVVSTVKEVNFQCVE